MPSRLWLAGLVLACLAQGACGRARGEPLPAAKPAVTGLPLPAAVLPQDQGAYYPSLLRLAGGAPADVAALADVQRCTQCHAEAVHEWGASAHAHASFDNPWYRASVDDLRQGVGYESSQHCAGCHDPLLLLAGKMTRDVKPSDPLASAGVTCLVCHSVQSTTSDGNASFSLSSEPVPMPVPGDAESLQRHRERLSPKALRTPGLCASCHRGFLGRHTGLDHHLTGMDEPGAWRASAYGGSRSSTLERVPEQSCKDCHMRPETAQKSDVSLKQGSLRSHRFPGGHTALAAISGDRRQLAANLEQLRGVVRLDVPVVFVNQKQQASDDPLELRAGDQLAVDVTLKNQGVGHTFPGGVKDLQDSWLELSVRDARGRVIARAGEQQVKAEDASAYVLRALLVDAGGKAETRHLVTHFGSVAYDHTVPPLGARSVRYAFTMPAGAVGPLTVSARLQHRRHRLDMREQACRATRSGRGRAFMQAARQLALAPLDGCAPEPVTLLGQVELQLGAAGAETPRWQRLYEHGLGMSLAVTDQLDQARYSAERALAELSAQPSADKWDLAMVAVLQGRIAARQGRLADALAAAARAEAWVGSQPAIERVRGDAYAQVWRFAEAAEAFAKITARSPFDTASFRELARTRMSAQDARGALTAAQQGLGLQPRDEGLLRCQALALEAEHAPDARAARDAFLFYRDPDDANAAKLSCDKQLAQCARDRMGVVTIELAPPPETRARAAAK